MIAFTGVPLPQLGANDTSAQILEWSVPAGTLLRVGEVLCSVETTKSVSDIESPATGYVTPLVDAGMSAQTGQVIAALTSERVSREDVLNWVAEQETRAAEPTGETKWTYKAELLARQHEVDIAAIPPSRGKVTEADVRAYLDKQPTHRSQPVDGQDLMDDRYVPGRMQRLLLVGGGYGAVQTLDIVANTPHQRVVAIMDDNPALQGKSVGGVPIVGGVNTEQAVEMLRAGQFDAAVITVSTSIPFRVRIFEAWREHGIPFANVIHPSAVVGTNVSMGQGNMIMALCKVGACATVGDNNAISSYCSIEHHGVLGSHCSFGPSVITSSGVHIHDRVMFGTGIFIEPFIDIGQDSIIGSGCAIWSHIAEGSLVKTKPNYIVRRRSER